MDVGRLRPQREREAAGEEDAGILPVPGFGPARSAFRRMRHREFCLDHSHTMLFDVVFDWGCLPARSRNLCRSICFRTAAAGRCATRCRAAPEAPYASRLKRLRGIVLQRRHRMHPLPAHRDAGGFEITTRQASLLQGLFLPGFNAPPPRAEGTEGERVASEPDMLWSGRAESLVLDKAPGRRTAVFSPSRRCAHIYRRDPQCRKPGACVGHERASVSTMAGGILPGRGPGALTEEGYDTVRGLRLAWRQFHNGKVPQLRALPVGAELAQADGLRPA